MFKPSFLRNFARAAQRQAPRASLRFTQIIPSSTRPFSYSVHRLGKSKDDQDHDAATTTGEPGESGAHEGQYARIDESITVEYPSEAELPKSHPVQGRGGFHFKRTLASFSMEGKVSVITGGARGLGLVMAQALVTSGADVALVDMNKDEAQRSAEELVETFKAENAGSEKYSHPILFVYEMRGTREDAC